MQGTHQACNLGLPAQGAEWQESWVTVCVLVTRRRGEAGAEEARARHVSEGLGVLPAQGRGCPAELRALARWRLVRPPLRAVP